MRIAIPEYSGRVSPVFDTCQRLLIFQMDDRGMPNPLQNEDLSCLPVAARVSRLRQLGVDVLLCGGVSDWLARQIEATGIRLVPWLAGNVEQVLYAYAAGRLPDKRLAMPGSWGGRRRFRRGRQAGGRDATGRRGRTAMGRRGV